MSHSPIQSLTERQRMVLMSHVQQGLFNPEIAANLFVNPRPMFLSTELSEDDVQNISEFLSSVDGLKQGQLASSSDFVDVDVTSIDARLNDKQVTILKCAIEQALTSVDALQDFFGNLHSNLIQNGLNDDDIRDVVIYTKTIKNIIELDRKADWVGELI